MTSVPPGINPVMFEGEAFAVHEKVVPATLDVRVTGVDVSPEQID